MKRIACGDTHSIVVAEGGSVFSWGLAEYGQTGIQQTERCVMMPTKVPFAFKIDRVYAGSLQSFFLAEDGRLLGCGLNDQMQLGFESSEEVVVNPSQVDLKLICGKNSWKFKTGCSHSMMMVKGVGGTKLYGWGLNKHGQLGVTKKDMVLPELLQMFADDTVSGFAVGGYHSAFILN